MENRTLAKIVAKAIFYASIQSSIGSVEMSSKFSVMNFSKDQETLQRACDALKSYIVIAIVWTIGTVLALYASDGWCGGFIGLCANAVMMGWIVISYIKAFKEAADRYGLKEPTLISKQNWMYITIGFMIAVAITWYLISNRKTSEPISMIETYES
jgi:small-conductance mechanosensitive channel